MIRKLDIEVPYGRSHRRKPPALLTALVVALLLAAVVPACSAPWSDAFYSFRVRISASVPSAGQYQLNLTPEMITAWMNEQADFKFKREYFAYDNVKLVEVDANGNVIDGNPSAGYKIMIGQQELVVNGGFEQQSGGSPTGWNIDNAQSFVLEQSSYNSSWCMTVQGTNQDRYACWQFVNVNSNTWYYYSHWLKGSASCAPASTSETWWWQPINHTYSDPYIPSTGWYHREFYFNPWDKTNWTDNRIEVRFERIPGSAVDDISLRECQVGFVVNAASAGTKYYDLYYSPLEGIMPHVPGQQVGSLPSQTLTVTKVGTTEWLDENIAYSVPSNSLGSLWYCATTKKVMENTPVPSASRTKVSLSCARNESEALQLVFRPSGTGEIRGVTASLTGPGGVVVPASYFDIRRARYVPIVTPSKTGLFLEEPVRSAFTGNLPDPLTKFAPVSFSAGGPNILIWVDVTIPRNLPAGTYDGQVALDTTGGVVSVPVELKVWDFVLPEKPSCRTSFQLARYANAYLYPFHKVTEQTDKYNLSRAYIAEMDRYKISETNPAFPYLFYPGGLAPFPGEADIENSWVLDELNLSTHSIDHEAGPLLADDTVEGTTPIVTSYYEPLAAHLAANGWLDNAFIMIDEPQPPAFQGVRNFINAFRLQPHAKDIKMAAYVYNAEAWDGLRNDVDILVPGNNDAGSIASPTATAAWPADKEVWSYYTQSIHQFIDAPSMDQRLMAPKNWWMGSKGISSWAIVIWWQENENVVGQNPWVNPITNMSGNGVFAYFYPPDPAGIDLPAKNMTIVPSLRLVLMRDGIEDFEYGTILDQIIADATALGMDTAQAVQARDRLRRLFDSPTSWGLSEAYWEQTRLSVGDTIAQYKAALGQTEPVPNYSDTSMPFDPDPRTRLLVHFDDGLAATTANDSSGNDVHGALNSGLAAQASHYTAGMTGFGNALQVAFENGVAKKVDFPASVKFGFGLENLTVEACIYPTENNSYWTLFQNYTGGDYAWMLTLMSGQMRMSAGWYGNSTWQSVVDTSTTWELNTWNHAAMTWQRDSDSGGRDIIRFWKNGVEVFSRDVTDLGQPMAVTGPAAAAGRTLDGHPWYSLIGKMDELRLSSGIRYGSEQGTVGGHITLESFVGGLSLLPVTVEIKQGGVLIDTRTLYLASNPGVYNLSSLSPGTYDLAFSAAGFLRRVVSGVQVSTGGSATVDVALKNGDVDGDNQVTSSDLSTVLKNVQ